MVSRGYFDVGLGAYFSSDLLAAVEEQAIPRHLGWQEHDYYPERTNSGEKYA